MVRLTSLSFAHPLVDADERARLCLPGSALASAHHRLTTTAQEAFLLSTCLRVEMAWAAGPEGAHDLIAGLYGDGSLFELGAVRQDEEAFLHLCRVAAGLESPLIGEPEVLGQFRQAVSVFRASSDRSGDLDRVLEAAIGVARTTRRELGDPPRGSLASVAAKATALLEPVAILGSGAMARAAAEHLSAREMTIFARRRGQVAGRDTLPWEAAEEALAVYPVVISTVPGKTRLFEDDVVAHALGSRREPLLLIDLGMPPGLSRPGPDHPVRYMGIDDLASLVDAPEAAEAEDHIVEASAAAWLRLSSGDRVGKVIAAMVGQAETAVTEEVQRFANRLSASEDPESVLKQLAHTVARRVLHRPISYVGSTQRGSEAVELFAEAFGVDDD